MKTIPVNFIGYGDWGSRFSQKVVDEGFCIQNLVTDKTNISVAHNNLIPRNNMADIDWTLPTFITTGPLYHHDILKHCKSRPFVEKPYYISGQSQTELEFKPYVNYHWYDSLKLSIIKQFIGYDWDNINIELFTTTKIDRGFSVLEDFFPHVISITKFLNRNQIKSHKIVKVTNDLYHIEFDYGFNKIIFDIGIGNKRYAKFKTENVMIETSKPTIIDCNGMTYTIKSDPLRDSIYRYYSYYMDESGDRIFYSNDFHTFILEMCN